MLTAIIVAGGSSRRMGFDKTFADLCGAPILTHSLRAFEKAESVGSIIVVGRESRFAEIEEIIQKQALKKVSAVIPGGLRRQDSVRCGLQNIASTAQYVAVHDAARPLVTPDLIERVYRLACEHGAAACASPIVDTLKRANPDGFIRESVDRSDLFAIQTPQIFRCDLLLRAYAEVFAKSHEITDEISALERINEKTYLLPNEAPNFKITYPGDLPLAEQILKTRSL